MKLQAASEIEIWHCADGMTSCAHSRHWPFGTRRPPAGIWPHGSCIQHDFLAPCLLHAYDLMLYTCGMT
eukprot:1160769-Pelagomonas_calceolata.AAC.13